MNKEITKESVIIKCANIHKKCWKIYDDYGGYDYNDQMLYQLTGLNETIEMTFNDKYPLETCLKEAEITYNWFKHIKKIRVLQESEPESLYG
jgi:hypothetical protein|tara:strand:+ start:379 stop:654 length:276 start_codon:yes stop_codon:yes gene_type:complete